MLRLPQKSIPYGTSFVSYGYIQLITFVFFHFDTFTCYITPIPTLQDGLAGKMHPQIIIPYPAETNFPRDRRFHPTGIKYHKPRWFAVFFLQNHF